MISFCANPKSKITYTIKNATQKDVDDIVKIWRQKANKEGIGWPRKIVYQEALDDPLRNLLLVAKNKFEETIGALRIYFRRDSQATLHEIVVDENFHSKGIGKALLKKAEIITKEKGKEFIRFKSPFDIKDAHAFYKKTGFMQVGKEKGKVRELFLFEKKL